MSDALIGYTGFVGGNLARHHHFDALYNSKNIGEIAGRDFDLLVCAGAPAEKWKANRDPERDLDVIRSLAETAGSARARFVVLISTIDIYASPREVDENTYAPPGNDAYGRHRFLLEKHFQDRFDTLVVRLPGLYGDGLKKNAIFDLLHDNQVEKIPHDGVFQYYSTERLWTDIERARSAGLRTVNLATEPIGIDEVAREVFGQELKPNQSGLPPVRYNVRTRYSGIFGGRNEYLEDKATVLAGIRRFVEGERQRKA